ncbi:hypothetical protein MDOR_08020 [Mycolicibacterium doricum]|jgi:CBS domain-containing protein|uniref:DUF294 domain-containing protein n=1 Tax=Mycolicibacterium doricum TaxID=126673 RepID=A0A1X1TM44_9MYCO|nr:putative nucleotidyltransferase substrate binding domain-containing protein [Mycolicibacterium doricum]MCV7269811.1 hypothetical protein [Mycolicibacterium doricum]ORV45647.1 hypothetical protein AWC01_01195 [Mycolicibacterium doricum]BBZ06633.1 hypothetical protein MDOR_08020 [Mycolicibacterium doricum]
MSSVPPSRPDIAARIARVDAAADDEQLRAAIDRAQAAILAERRASATALATAWSTVLLRGVAAGVRLAAGAADWTWYASGSAARGEAVPRSDVETMVVLGDTVGPDEKSSYLSRAADVHNLLERCGIQGDANGVLASRPRFCRRARGWTQGIEQWTAEPQKDRGVVMTGLLADSTALPGPRVLPEDALRAKVVTAAVQSYPVRQAMLRDATAVRASVPSPLRLFARMADTVDVKLAAIDPVVKIARWAALASGSDALSTPARLDAAAADVLDPDDASSLRDCFEWLLRFRWGIRRAAVVAARPVSDVISLSDLAPQERAALRSVAREVSRIRRKLDYLASASAFR